MGVLACCGCGILLNIPAALVMPLPSLVLSVSWLFWVLVYGGSLLKAAAKLLALTPSTILINQAAPRYVAICGHEQLQLQTEHCITNDAHERRSQPNCKQLKSERLHGWCC